MSYTPYLVANFSTGVDVRLQPWLRVDDAMQELYDGYVYRGVMSKRPGYKPYAIGSRAGSPAAESRVVNTLTNDVSRNSVGARVVGNDTPGPYLIVTQNGDIRRGSITITADTGASMQTATDLTETVNPAGLGILTTTPAGGTGTVNYSTGAISVTFANNVTAGIQLMQTYSYYPDEPVMGIMNFVDISDTKVMIIGTTKRLNIYNSTTNRLDYLGSDMTITGITIATPGVITTTAAVNLNVGDFVYFYGIRGTVQLNNTTQVITAVSGNTFSITDTSTMMAYVSGGFVQRQYTGTKFSFWSWVNYKDKSGNPRLIFTNNADQVQYYAPSNSTGPVVGDYVNYPTKASPDFLMYQDGGTTPIDSLLALQAFVYKDRLQFQRPTEEGIIKPQRIRISGTGTSCDNFTTAATGAGLIDIPDGNWINGCASNRDDLVLFTEGSTWIEQYTGDDTVPIKIARIDESRGSGAAFAAITYLNRTTTASQRGLIISDGYRVERADEVIPDFSFNDVDANNFELCFVGVVDEDRDHYLLYPTAGQVDADTVSNYILTTNYEEDNYAIYRIPVSCMGVFQLTADVLWSELLMYNNWNEFAQDYTNWNDFNYSRSSPISIGGGHHGEVWQLNVNQSEDNPLTIRNIVQIDATTLQITTDWNNYSLYTDDGTLGADYIEFEGVQGMLEINNKQYPIINVIDNNNFQIQVPSSVSFSTYTINTGRSIRVIPFTSTFKQFNPFLNMDKKVRCGWIYFYVSTTGTLLTRNVAIADIINDTPLVIGSILVETVTQHGFSTGDQISFFGITGTTQLNDTSAFITVVDALSFTLNGVNSTAFGDYTSGGYAVIPENAVIQVQIITNDANTPVRIENGSPIPLQPNCTNLKFQDESKKWYKLFVNQIGKFIQLKVTSIQAGASISIHATIYGFQGIGRII